VADGRITIGRSEGGPGHRPNTSGVEKSPPSGGARRHTKTSGTSREAEGGRAEEERNAEEERTLDEFATWPRRAHAAMMVYGYRRHTRESGGRSGLAIDKSAKTIPALPSSRRKSDNS